jgi:hypothetical protein
MAAAAERAGHDNWGDEGFTEPLALLVESCLATGNLSARGRRVLRSVLLRHLGNRLYVQAYIEHRPDAAGTPVERPLVVTGLPRTGTSLLHNLLALDRRHRFLPLWQALHPVPPGTGGGPDEAKLVRQADTWLERFYAIAPGFRTVHPLSVRGPEECDALLQNAFASQHFDDMFDAEAYSRWFYGTELNREYVYYALQLRVLSTGAEAGKRWVLKSPGHLGHLDELLRALPGACVLHCHRDPAQSVPSYASLIFTVRRPNGELTDPRRVGEQALRRCAVTMTRALTARARIEDRVLDVSFRELIAEPLRVVTRIYQWLGTPLDATAVSAMRRWLAENPRERHGAHMYDPGNFGLPADRTRAAFGGYLDRFGSLSEPSSTA